MRDLWIPYSNDFFVILQDYSLHICIYALTRLCLFSHLYFSLFSAGILLELRLEMAWTIYVTFIMKGLKQKWAHFKRRDGTWSSDCIFLIFFSFATSQKSLKIQWWKRQHKFNSVRLDKLICFDPWQWTCYTRDNGRQRTSSDMKPLLWPSPITPSVVSNSRVTQKCALFYVKDLKMENITYLNGE